MSTMSKYALGALAAVSLVATPGCISLLPESEPVSLYRLNGLMDEERAPSANAQTLVIDRITAPRGLAVDKVALLRDGELAYIKQLDPDQIRDLFPALTGLPEGIDLYALLGADGTPLGLTESRGSAISSAFEIDLEPVSVH